MLFIGHYKDYNNHVGAYIAILQAFTVRTVTRPVFERTAHPRVRLELVCSDGKACEVDGRAQAIVGLGLATSLATPLLARVAPSQ